MLMSAIGTTCSLQEEYRGPKALISAITKFNPDNLKPAPKVEKPIVLDDRSRLCMSIGKFSWDKLKVTGGVASRRLSAYDEHSEFLTSIAKFEKNTLKVTPVVTRMSVVIEVEGEGDADNLKASTIQSVSPSSTTTSPSAAATASPTFQKRASFAAMMLTAAAVLPPPANSPVKPISPIGALAGASTVASLSSTPVATSAPVRLVSLPEFSRWLACACIRARVFHVCTLIFMNELRQVDVPGNSKRFKHSLNIPCFCLQ
jgi:hypothetical protein